MSATSTPTSTRSATRSSSTPPGWPGCPKASANAFRSAWRTRLWQAADAAWAELPPEIDTRLTPRETISRIDDRRSVDELEPLLVGWHVRTQTAEATACPLAAADLEPAASADGWTDRWLIEAAFDRPLAHGATEDEALRARFPILARWLRRCHEDAGVDAGALTIRRAPGAPALVSYWPQAGRVYVNPVMLLLWNPPPPLRTVGQGLRAWPLSACVRELVDHCSAHSLAPDGTPCAAAIERPEQWCVAALADAEGASLRSCVRQRSGFDPECELPTNAPLWAYDDFIDAPACLAALDACMERPDTRFTPDPPPDDDYDDVAPAGECAADCLSELGPDCAEVVCDGCADSDSSGCDGDGAGSACDGCEGDTY